MKIKVEEPKRIEDGKHQGFIKAVSYRTEPFKYADLTLEFEGGKTLKYGLPTTVTPDSRLGQLLIQFGASLQIGQEVDPEEVFVGKKCEFMTLTKTTERGSFATVVKDSLKPLKHE